MIRLSRPTLTLGAAALSLAVAGTPALAAGHGGGKKPHLTHTHLTLRATQEKVTKNDKFKATVVAKLRAHKNPLAGEAVELYQRDKGATKWADTGSGATTDANGAATFTFVQSENKQQYRVKFAGDSTYAKSHSGMITIHRQKGSSSSTS